MVSYSQLWNMDLSRLRSAAATSSSLAGSLSGRGGEVASKAHIPGGMWSGNDAAAASGLLSPQASPLWDASDAFNGAQGVLDDLSAALDTAKERLAEAHDAVAGTAAYITGDGTVKVPPGLDEEENDRATTAAKRARDIIDEALTDAGTADGDASAALSGAVLNNPYVRPYIENTPLDGEWWKGVGQAGKDWANGVWNGIYDKGREDFQFNGPTTSRTESGWRWNAFEADGTFKGNAGPFDTWAGPSLGLGGDFGSHNSVEAQAGVGAGVGVNGSAGAGPFTVNGGAGVEVGARAGAGLEIGVDDGKFVAGGHAKGAFGFGGSLKGGIEVDIDQFKDSWRDFSEKVVPEGGGKPVPYQGPTT